MKSNTAMVGKRYLQHQNDPNPLQESTIKRKADQDMSKLQRRVSQVQNKKTASYE